MQKLFTEIKNELVKVDSLKKLLSEELDEKLILDTIEGETNLQELLFEIDKEIFETEAFAEALSLQIEKLTKRKEAFERRIESLKMIILSSMDNAGIKTLKNERSTITIKTTPPKCEILDESKIPSMYWVKKDPCLDKRQLLKDLKNGERIEGVELSEQGITIQIRRI